MFSWLMAKYYDYMLRDAEEKCLKNWRKTLLQDLSGNVLERDAVQGQILIFILKVIKHLVLAEPNPYMQRATNLKLKNYPLFTYQ